MYEKETETVQTAADQNHLEDLIPEKVVEPELSRFRRVVEICFAAVFFCYVLLVCTAVLYPQENFSFFKGNAEALTTGFVIKDTGESITIPRHNDSRYNEGITIEGTLPGDIQDEDYLMISLAHQDCQVIINGNTVYNYEYTKEKEENSSVFSTLSSYNAMIPLSSEDAAGTIEITYAGEFPEYASNIGRIQIGTYGALIGSLLQRAGLSFVFASMSLVLGLFMTVIGAVLAIRKKQTAVFHIGTFAICISLWILCESSMRQIYMKDLSVGFYLTMSSLSLCCTPLLLFFNEMQFNRYHRLYYSTAAVNLAAAVLFFLLQITHILNYMYTLKYMQAEMALTALIAIITIINDLRKKNPTYLGRAFIAGIGALSLAALLEVINMWRSLNNTRGQLTGLGLFLFLVSLTYTAVRALAMQMKTQQNEVIKSKEQTEEMGIQLVTTLVNAVDAKDPYTNGHSNRVAMYAREIAKRDGKSEYYQNRLFYMAIVHDIGKIGIPDQILQKPGRLSDDEFSVIKTHPLQGFEILSDATQIPWIVIGARWHHERYDGKGYPDGLAGEQIPEEARIIAVADAYDAMTSDRAYRSRMDQQKVRSIIEEGKGTQFDPHFADIMIQMIDNDKEYNLKGSTGNDLLGIVNLSLLLDRGLQGKGAFTTDSDSFRQIYQFLKKYARRNNTGVQLVLLTLQGKDSHCDLDAASVQLADVIRNTIRQSDIMTQLNEAQYMIILTDTSTESAETAVIRIINRFEAEENTGCKLAYDVTDIRK